MLSQSLHQKLLQKLSPQQIQLMKLLQVPTIALEQRIKEELQENPALEEGAEADEYEENQEIQDEVDDIEPGEEVPSTDSQDYIDLDDYIQDEDVPYYKTNASNRNDEERTEIPIVVSKTFHDLLLSQLDTSGLGEKEYIIAEYLIGNIDDDGYLRRPIKSIVDDLAFSQNVFCSETELGNILKVIQSFDPAGVGARNLQECLLIQLNRKNSNNPYVQMAKIVIKDYMLRLDTPGATGAFTVIVKEALPPSQPFKVWLA